MKTRYVLILLAIAIPAASWLAPPADAAPRHHHHAKIPVPPHR